MLPAEHCEATEQSGGTSSIRTKLSARLKLWRQKPFVFWEAANQLKCMSTAYRQAAYKKQPRERRVTGLIST
jgi:hypothetical protein